jgi:hypothetical protein
MTSRQLAQQARRDRERHHQQQYYMVSHSPSYHPYTATQFTQHGHQHLENPHLQQYLLTLNDTPLPHQDTQHPLAQRLRWDRQRQVSMRLLPIARRPLLPPHIDGTSFRHELGPCNIMCRSCKADHWLVEKTKESTSTAPIFSSCCMSGKIAMEKFEDPPEPLYSLLTDPTLRMFSFNIIFYLTND